MRKHAATQETDLVVTMNNPFPVTLRRIRKVLRPVFADRSRLQFIIQPLFWLALIFILGQALWIYTGLQANSSILGQRVSVEIPMGSSVFQIGRLLEEKGLITNRESFVWYVYLTGKKTI